MTQTEPNTPHLQRPHLDSRGSDKTIQVHISSSRWGDAHTLQRRQVRVDFWDLATVCIPHRENIFIKGKPTSHLHKQLLLWVADGCLVYPFCSSCYSQPWIPDDTCECCECSRLCGGVRNGESQEGTAKEDWNQYWKTGRIMAERGSKNGDEVGQGLFSQVLTSQEWLGPGRAWTYRAWRCGLSPGGRGSHGIFF